MTVLLRERHTWSVLFDRRRRKKRVVYIATIEKANGLINSLIEEGRLLSLGLVVVDEVSASFLMSAV